MAEIWTPLKLIQWTKGYFEKAGIPNSRLDAELLLAHLLKCKRIDLYTNHERTIGEKDLEKFKGLIQRRVKREPLQYILGETEFYGLKFKVTPDVLIPRPETELLVEEALKTSPPSPLLNKERGDRGEVQILDIGTGSGCIAVTLAKNLPDAKIVATDISTEALEIAKENTRRNEVDPQIEFILADIAPWRVFEAEERKFDLIVSNPPYISSGELESLQPEVRDFEPRRALDGGHDGLELIQKILSEAIPHIKTGGQILLEIGEDQGGKAVNLLEKMGLAGIQVIKDYAGQDRLVKAVKK